ncbi:MAG: hypothetical protein ACJ75J_01415 [Cytophagaceae bacterium]
MKGFTLFVIFLLSALVSCEKRSAEISTAKADTSIIDKDIPVSQKEASDKLVAAEEFRKYVASLKTLSLPFTFSFEKEFPDYYAIGADSLERMRNYITEQSGFPYRKVFETDSIFGIIFSIPSDVQYPYLVIYDKKNLFRIDSMGLYESAGVDDCFYEVNRMTLQKDFTMNFYDSTFTCETDERHKHIKGADKIKIVRKKYRIERSGKIKLLAKEETNQKN